MKDMRKGRGILDRINKINGIGEGRRVERRAELALSEAEGRRRTP